MVVNKTDRNKIKKQQEKFINLYSFLNEEINLPKYLDDIYELVLTTSSEENPEIIFNRLVIKGIKNYLKNTSNLDEILVKYLDSKCIPYEDISASKKEFERISQFISGLDIDVNKINYEYLVEKSNVLSEILNNILKNDIKAKINVPNDSPSSVVISSLLDIGKERLTFIEEHDYLVDEIATEFYNINEIKGLMIPKLPRLTREEFQHLHSLMLNGTKEESERARNILLERNMLLVVKFANIYVNRGLDIEDLIQEGFIGLQKALMKYDPNKEAAFSTYAVLWIKQSIRRALADKSRTIRVPAHAFDEMVKVLLARDTLAEKLEENPTFDQIAHEVNMPVDKVISLFAIAEPIVSLNSTINDEEVQELEEFISDGKENYDDFSIDYKRRLIHEEILKTLNNVGLTDREKSILFSRYGFIEGSEAKTLEEIAIDQGLTRERIRQILISIQNKIVKSPYIYQLAELLDNPKEALHKLASQEGNGFLKLELETREKYNLSINSGEILKDRLLPKYQVNAVKNEDYEGLKELVHDETFNEVCQSMPDGNPILVALASGFVNNKYFSKKAMAQLLEVEEEKIEYPTLQNFIDLKATIKSMGLKEQKINKEDNVKRRRVIIK